MTNLPFSLFLALTPFVKSITYDGSVVPWRTNPPPATNHLTESQGLPYSHSVPALPSWAHSGTKSRPVSLTASELDVRHLGEGSLLNPVSASIDQELGILSINRNGQSVTARLIRPVSTEREQIDFDGRQVSGQLAVVRLPIRPRSQEVEIISDIGISGMESVGLVDFSL